MRCECRVSQRTPERERTDCKSDPLSGGGQLLCFPRLHADNRDLLGVYEDAPAISHFFITVSFRVGIGESMAPRAGRTSRHRKREPARPCASYGYVRLSTCWGWSPIWL